MAPQPRDGLFSILADLDQASVEAYFLASESVSDPLPSSPFNGFLISLRFDPVEVLSLVDEIWPARWAGVSGRGRKPADPLPMVCYLLRLCDAEHGTVFNLSEAYLGLQEDKQYRELCGYGDRVPSSSVFKGVHRVMVDNWARFQACVAGSERLKELALRLMLGGRECLGNSEDGKDSPVLREAFRALGPDGEFAPRYLDDGRFYQVSRPVGRPRGRAAWQPVGRSQSECSDSLVRVVDVQEISGTPGSRDWRAYNAAQTNEATEFRAILGHLADLISVVAAEFQGPRQRGGQPYPLGKVFFAVVEKAHSGLSSRRYEGLLKLSAKYGFVRNAPGWTSDGFDWGSMAESEAVVIPQFNTVERYLRCQWLTPLLLEMLTLIACPLREIEDVFAVDGTGWSTRWYGCWQDNKEAPDAEKQQWVKLHLVSGVKSNIIARAAISPGNHHDSPYFKGLMREVYKHFDVRRVLADLGYSSRDNNALEGELGAEVRIPFKSNTRPPVDDGSEWSNNLALLLNDPEKFFSEYHKRSNVESTNGAVKVTQPQKLRCRSFEAQVNEVLAIMVAYNLRVLAREVWVSKLEPDLESEVLAFRDCIAKVVEMRRGESVVEAA